MGPRWKGMLFRDLLNIPAALIKALRSKTISYSQLQKGIEVKSNEIVKSAQVSQVCNHSIKSYESY